MNLWFLLIIMFQLILPLFLIWLVLNTRKEERFWMADLFEILHDENIMYRHREEHEGALYTRNGIVRYRAEDVKGASKEMIRFEKNSLSLHYKDENLVAIVFDRAGELQFGPREQYAGKYLLGIVCREIQLAKPL